MVLIRTPDSRYFEEAHLVLRAERDTDENESGEMIREANRIIETAGYGAENGRKHLRKTPSRLWSFCLGALLGGGVMGMVWLFCTFF